MVATDVNQPRTGVVSRIRMVAFYAANALLGLIVAADFVMHALTFAGPHLIHVTAHEIVSATVIGAVISQFVAPRRAIAAAQALLALFVAAWGMDALTLRFSGFGVVMLLGVLVVVLHPARGAVFSFRGGFSPTLAIITVLSAVPPQGELSDLRD